MKHSLYRDGVKAYIDDRNDRLERIITNPSLELAEKNLLKARRAIMKRDWITAREILERNHSSCEFLKGERNFLLASLCSFESQWQEATVFAHQAILNFYAAKDNRGLFLSHYNLSVYYNRLGLDTLSITYIEQSEVFAQTAGQKCLLLRARACEFSRKGDYINAVQIIEKALLDEASLDSVDRATLYAVAADIFFRANKWPIALHALSKLSQNKKIRDRARVRLDYLVLEKLCEIRNGTAALFQLGAMPRYISENAEYKLKWLIITNLQGGDWSPATRYWQDLSALMPQRYNSLFRCQNDSDEHTIFMTAIRQLLGKAAEITASGAAMNTLNGKLKLLDQAMRLAPIPLRKEELIEKVWQQPYDPALDARFYKLVERLKKVSHQPINLVNHTYRFDRK